MIQTERELLLKKEEMVTNKTSYDRYRELGGIINEVDYQKALARAGQTTSLRKTLVAQAKLIARVAGVPLDDDFQGCPGKITILYGVLRTDSNSNPGEQYHHSQMCDQRLFAEALRMLDFPDLLAKVIKAHPNICFV